MACFAVLGAWVACLELQVIAIPGLQLGPVFGDYAHNVIEVLAGAALPRRRLAGAARADRVAADRHRRARVGARQPLLHGRPLRPRVAADPLAGRRRLPPLPGARDGRRASRSCAPAPRTCRTTLWTDGVDRRARGHRGQRRDRSSRPRSTTSSGKTMVVATDARLPAHRPAADRRRRRRAGGHGLAAGPHLGAARRRHRRCSGSPTPSTSSSRCSGTLQSPAWYDIGWSLGLLLVALASWQPAVVRRPAAPDGLRFISVPLGLRRRSAWRC